MNPRLAELFDRLQRSGFADLKGLQASARVPISERLLNEVIKESLPPAGALREVRVTPQVGNRFDLQVKLTRPAFLPPLSVTAVVERQPQFPQSPDLVLKLSSIPGIMSLAGGAAAFFNLLPPGIRMEGERVFVDIAELARQQGRGDVLGLIRRFHVTTERGAAVLDVELGI